MLSRNACKIGYLFSLVLYLVWEPIEQFCHHFSTKYYRYLVLPTGFTIDEL